MTVTGILRFSNHLQASFDVSFDAVTRDEYEVIGTRGTIKASFAYRPDLNEDNGKLLIRSDTGTFEITIHDDFYVRTIENMCDCVLSGKTDSRTGENTWRNMKVIDAIEASLKNGSIVSNIHARQREVNDWEAECGIAALFRR